MNRKFREICDVAATKPWPDPSEERLNEATDVPYYTPHFNKSINFEENDVICRKVARLVWHELEVRTRVLLSFKHIWLLTYERNLLSGK